MSRTRQINIYITCFHTKCCSEIHTSLKVIPQNCSIQNVHPMFLRISQISELSPLFSKFPLRLWQSLHFQGMKHVSFPTIWNWCRPPQPRRFGVWIHKHYLNFSSLKDSYTNYWILWYSFANLPAVEPRYPQPNRRDHDSAQMHVASLRVATRTDGKKEKGPFRNYQTPRTAI